MKKALIFGSLAFSIVQSLAATLNMVTCHEGAQPYDANGKSGGPFYGYKTDSQGPGDDAFTLCLEGARKYHAPLFLILDKDGSESAAFINTANDKMSEYGDRYLNQWINRQRNSYNTRFCYFRGTTAKACKDAWEFAAKCGVPSGSFVYVAYYRYKDGNEQIQCGTLGTVQGFEGIASGFASKYNLSKDTTSEVVVKRNADFACGDGENSGLQMVSNTTERVYVPFVRKENLTNVETNWLAVAYPGETVASTNIQFVWSATGPAATNLEVAVSVKDRWTSGGKVRLEYVNLDGESVATNWISCVTVTNGTFDSPWMPGEKAADELGWGEWTLDFAAATNRARQTGGVTVAVLGSPVWLDIDMLFGAEATHDSVTNLCRTMNATLAVIDHADTKGASLLSHVVEDGWSGTPFLSRHGLSTADPAVTGLRAEHDRLWNTLQTMNDPDRVEVAVLRANGTCVGMLDIWRNAKGNPTDWAENLARLRELIALTNDQYENKNNKPQADVAEVAFGGEATALNSLIFSDKCDCFKLTGLQTKAPFAISLVDCDEALRETKSRITVSVVCVTNEATCAFRALELVPGTTNVWCCATEEERDSAFVRVTAWATEPPNPIAKMPGMGSKVQYRVQIAAAPAAPGAINLVTESDTVEVTEEEIEFPIEFERSGYSGAVSVEISLDKARTTAPASSYSFPSEPVTVNWGDVEWGRKTCEALKFFNKGDWDEGGDVVLTLSGGEYVGTNKLWLTVTQKEDPTAPTGKIVISEPFAAERFYAEAEDKLPVQIDRVGGKRGPLAVKVSVPEGTVSTNRLDWKRYVTERKTVIWTLPALKATQPYRNVSLRLIGIDGAPVASNTLNVCVLPTGALKPETNDYRTAVAQYCELTDAKVRFAGTLPEGATLAPMRITGALPSGVGTPTVDAATNLVFSGVSKNPGDYTSIWWLAVKNAKRQVIGYSYPVKVTISVKALVETDKQGKVTGGLNPTFVKARTLSSLPMINTRYSQDGQPTPGSDGLIKGVMDLTFAKTGKMSARYRMAGGKSVSFSASGLSHVDLDSGLATFNAASSGYELEVRVHAYASIAIDLRRRSDGMFLHFETPAHAVEWSKTKSAAQWMGNYTLAFEPVGEWDAKTQCFGSPVLQLKLMSQAQFNAGRVTYAGYLPNGKTVSGSATLAEGTNDAVVATLPIFTTSATDTLATMVDLSSEETAVVQATERISTGGNPYWSASVTSYWSHVEANVPELSYGNLYVPFGSRFEDQGWTAADFKAKIDGATSAQYNKTSGLVSGSLRRTVGEKTVTEAWKAVVTPGWEVLLGGASWRNVSTNAVNDKTGKPVRRTVQVGEPVEIDAE